MSSSGRMRPPGAGIAVLSDPFPRLSETFVRAEVRALRELGQDVHVESGKRPARRRRAVVDDIEASYLADDSDRERLLSMAWLVARHPLACARDLVDRRRWRREEPVRKLRRLAPMARRIVRRGDRHLHAHFAKWAALDAMRISRLTGIPYSVTAHAYDIYKEPANLREKLAGAAFAAGVSDHAVRDLRGVVGERADGRIERIAMGVDGGRFRRRVPQPGGRVVAGIGRLVEKKGFTHLIDAAALLRDSGSLDRLVILGDGDLGDELRAQAERLALEDAIDWLGPGSHDEVRSLLERVDVLAVPCVIAADGDRDGLPVVVYEALAMEVPVVASDEVGLSEVVRPQWGRLVPPADAEALAGAITEVLSLPPEQRASMGRAGREFVTSERDVRGQASRLLALIELGAPARGTRGGPGRSRRPACVARVGLRAVRPALGAIRRRLRRLRGPLQRARRRSGKALRRLRRALRLSRLVRERLRFAVRDLRTSDGVHRYRLRSDDARVCLRHGRMAATFDEVFGRAIYDPLPEVARAIEHRGGSPLIVDLGGHVGYASARLLALFPSGRVIAFEPDPASAGLHAETIRLNGADDRWQLVEACASNRDGERAFVASGTSGSHVADPGEQPVLTSVSEQDVLPQLQRADLAKIDIEGGEWRILGDERFGDAGPRVLVLEYHRRGCPGRNPRAEATALLERAGYRIVDHPYGPRERRRRQGLLWAIKRS